MRILLLTLYFAPDIAANAVIMTELAEELASLGHQVTVVTAFPHYASNVIDHRYRGRLVQREEHRGIRIIRTYLYTSPQKARFLVRFLNYVSFNLLSTIAGIFSGPQDVILAPSPPLTVGVSAWIIGRLKRIPNVYNVQDINPDVLIKLGILRNPLGIAFSKWLERFVYRHSTHITVLSEGFYRNLASKGVPPSKLTIIPNFVDIDFIRPLPSRNGFRKKLDLQERFVVLYAGNLGHSQDIECLLACADLLRDRHDIAFVIVGNGSRKPRMEALASEMNLPNVRFLPFQPREQVPEIYAAADASLVMLKKDIAVDSVPSKAYTIMASARPIIAAVDPGSDAWDLVERAQCGICVPPEDPHALAEAIKTLHADPDLRARMGRNGRNHVVRYFNPKAVAQQYHELLAKLLDGRR